MPVLIDVSDILPELGLEKRIKKSLSPTMLKRRDKELDLIEPVDMDVVVTNIGNRLLAEGRIQGRISLECNRCLNIYQKEFSIGIKESFCKKGQCEGEEDVLEIISNKIDLHPAISQSLRLWVPMKNLCKEDCKGLCPKCGRNLNEGACGCPKDEIDSRLLVLKDFFSKEE